MGEIILEGSPAPPPWNPEDPNHTFYFHVDDGRVIDAAVGGNAARWINHSCNPNCEADEEEGRVFIKSLRNIKAGEELNYDYGLIIDEPYTKKLKAEYPAGAAAGTAGARCWRPSAAAEPGMNWPAETIWEAVAPSLPGFTVEILPEIDSATAS